MNRKFFTARNVALLGILIALVIVLQLFASAIPMFGVTLNFSLIPIALAGILVGWIGGAIVGFSCGLVVFITMAVLGQEPSTAFLLSSFNGLCAKASQHCILNLVIVILLTDILH